MKILLRTAGGENAVATLTGMTTPADLLAPGGRLSARLAGWESRPQQLEMAALVARAIAERRHAMLDYARWAWRMRRHTS